MFPDNFLHYASNCLRDKVKPGKVCLYILPNSKPSGPLAIFNLATKNHWEQPSKLEWIEAGLEDIDEYMWALKYKSLALPAIGCSNGGLDWTTVTSLIVSRFAHATFTVTVYIPPGQNPC